MADTPMIIETGGGSNGNNGGFGGFGDGGWIFIILFVILLLGVGGNGYGGSRGGDSGMASMLPFVMSSVGHGGHSCSSAIADGFALNNIQGGIGAIQRGICDSTYALNNTINNGFHGIDRELCDVSRQISDCCCQTQSSIKDVRFDLANGLCGLNNTIQNVGRDLMDNQNSDTRAILDFLTNKEIDNLRTENQSLRFSASQDRQNALLTTAMTAQTNALIDRIAPYPVPSFNVCAPYNFGGYGFGGFNNGGYGNRCGCNCGC